MIIGHPHLHNIYRPGVAGADLQTSPLLIK